MKKNIVLSLLLLAIVASPCTMLGMKRGEDEQPAKYQNCNDRDEAMSSGDEQENRLSHTDIPNEKDIWNRIMDALDTDSQDQKEFTNLISQLSSQRLLDLAVMALREDIQDVLTTLEKLNNGLLDALMEDQVVTIQKALTNKQINSSNIKDCLYITMMYNNLNAFDLLLANTTFNPSELSLCADAVYERKPLFIGKLIRRGFYLQSPKSGEEMYNAYRAANQECFLHLLDGVDKNSINQSLHGSSTGYVPATILTIAINRWDIDLIKRVIAKGAKVTLTHLVEAYMTGKSNKKNEQKITEIINLLLSKAHVTALQLADAVAHYYTALRDARSMKPGDIKKLTLNLNFANLIGKIIVPEPMILEVAQHQNVDNLLCLLAHGAAFDQRLVERKESYEEPQQAVINFIAKAAHNDKYKKPTPRQIALYIRFISQHAAASIKIIENERKLESRIGYLHFW